MAAPKPSIVSTLTALRDRWFPTADRIRDRRGLFGFAAVHGLAMVAALVYGADMLSPLFSADPPAEIPGDEGDGVRYGLPEETRRDIFQKMAAREDFAIARARRHFGNHEWSVGDDRAWFEKNVVRQLAQQHSIGIGQAYLILDEGIREQWPRPDGRPLTPTVPPLNPRTQ